MTRPDLSSVTQAEVKQFSQIQGIGYGINDLKFEAQMMNACLNIPALVQIAEMFYDSMEGTEAEKGFNFQLVKKTLNDIAG